MRVFQAFSFSHTRLVCILYSFLFVYVTTTTTTTVLQNEFMGFADFRAAFVAGTGAEWTIEPREGSLTAKEATPFLLRFKAQNPGVSESILVIETEDFKKTYKLIGGTS
jgi:hypothetical protein